MQQGFAAGVRRRLATDHSKLAQRVEPADTGNMSKTVYSLPFLTEITDLPLDFLTRLRKLWFIDRADLEFEPNEGPKNMGNSSSFLINRDLRKQKQDVIYSSSKNCTIESNQRKKESLSSTLKSLPDWSGALQTKTTKQVWPRNEESFINLRPSILLASSLRPLPD